MGVVEHSHTYLCGIHQQGSGLRVEVRDCHDLPLLCMVQRPHDGAVPDDAHAFCIVLYCMFVCKCVYVVRDCACTCVYICV